MPIGKDSIQKRVAKTAEAPAAEVKPAAKKTTSTKKPTATAAKKPAAKKAVDTTVIANISPEVVEKVTGHKEGTQSPCIRISQKLPTHLL